jgi:hypothetical protein
LGHGWCPVIIKQSFEDILLSWLGVAYSAELEGSRVIGVDCSELFVQVAKEAGLEIADRSSQEFLDDFMDERHPWMGPQLQFAFYGENISSIEHMGYVMGDFIVHSTNADGFSDGVQVTRNSYYFSKIGSKNHYLRWLDWSKFLNALV